MVVVGNAAPFVEPAPCSSGYLATNGPSPSTRPSSPARTSDGRQIRPWNTVRRSGAPTPFANRSARSYRAVRHIERVGAEPGRLAPPKFNAGGGGRRTRGAAPARPEGTCGGLPGRRRRVDRRGDTPPVTGANGLCSFAQLVDRESRAGITVTTWENQAAAEALSVAEHLRTRASDRVGIRIEQPETWSMIRTTARLDCAHERRSWHLSPCSSAPLPHAGHPCADPAAQGHSVSLTYR